ncbi:MAG TPA: membrane protein insertase YidC [Candidatus Binataceae bacterium]
MDVSRIILAFVLSLVLVVAYQELVLKRMYPPPSQQNAQPGGTAVTGAIPPNGAPIAAGVPAAVASGAAGSAPAPANAVPVATESASLQGVSPPGAAERTIEISTDLYVAQFTTRGARLKSFKLKHYNETVSPKSGSYEMVRPSPNGRLPLGALVVRGDQVLDDHALDYSSNAPDKSDLDANGHAMIVFTAQTADGSKIEKTFTMRGGSYVYEMNVAISGGPPLAQSGLTLSQPLTELSGGYRDIPELQADIQDKVLTETESKLRKGVEPVSGAIQYAGFGDRYFLTAYLPESPAAGTLSMSFLSDEAIARLLFDGATQIKSRVYMGPKLLVALEAASPSLRKSIDFGWMSILALALLRALEVFHRVAPNWGVDIILMTLALRIVMLPMSIRSQRSMMKMQRLQPQMERMRAQYKDDNERLQREMVDLYKRNHVNPLGGCAPMALQLPIFIGLYEALLNAIELRHAPFIGWITDLSTPDCLSIPGMPMLPYTNCHGIPVLVLLMGLSTFLQQKMSPTSPDPNQQKMMMLTPIVFTVMLINFPAGLSLYYFSSNVLGIIQQFFLNREFKQYSPVTA